MYLVVNVENLKLFKPSILDKVLNKILSYVKDLMTN